jgi:hypothetical protein
MEMGVLPSIVKNFSKSFQEDSLAYARRYHQQFSSQRIDVDSPWEKSEVPELVMAWLHVAAHESLKYLHDMKILRKNETGLYSTIIAFVAQSVASLSYRELKTSNISTVFKVSYNLSYSTGPYFHTL